MRARSSGVLEEQRVVLPELFLQVLVVRTVANVDRRDEVHDQLPVAVLGRVSNG